MTSDRGTHPAASQVAASSMPTEVAATQRPSSEIPPRAEDSTSASSEDKSANEKNGGTPLEKAQSATPSQAEGLGKARVAVIMSSLCMALFLAALDMTISATALPQIAAHFSATTAQYTWVSSSYLLANAASVPLWGKLSDIFGRKPVILLANVIFLVGSLLCAVSNSIEMLLVGRIVQGVGGGGLIILVNIVVSDLFSLRERAKYFGFIGATWSLASALGPIVGGAFTEKVSWRWCFYINLPLDGFAFVMLVFFLKLQTPRTPFFAGIKAMDWVGVVAIVCGVVMFLLGLESGGVTHPWDSAYTVCLIVFGALILGLFFVYEWKVAKYPIIPPRLFNNRSACAAYAACFLHGVVFIAGSFFLPLYFQAVLSAKPLMSGIYLLPFVFVLSFQVTLTGLFIKKTGRYLEPIWFGFIFMTLGYGLFIDLEPSANWAKIFIYQIIAGIGVGPNFQAPLIALQSTIHPSDMATATATFGFVRQLSSALSIVIGGVIFTNVLAEQIAQLESSSALPPGVLSELSASSSGSNTPYLRTLPTDQKSLVDQAYTHSLSRMWIFYTAVSALAILVSLLIRKKVLSRQHQETKTGLEAQEAARLERLEHKRIKKEQRTKGEDDVITAADTDDVKAEA